MLYRKKGFPEEGENVVCTVTKIQYHSVFAKLNEYWGKKGMLHISEIAPGRIRNIYDYVKEGKVIVCKVLRIDENKGHIDLSLRRVSQAQQRKKLSRMKQETKAERLIEDASEKLDMDFKKLYQKIASTALDKFEYVYDAFFAVIQDEYDIKNLGLTKKEQEVVEEFVRERIKKPKVIIKGKVKFISYEGDGVETIKKVLGKMEKVDKRLEIDYAGAGKYNLAIECEEFKDAEESIDKALAIAKEAADGKQVLMDWERQEGRRKV